MRNRDPFCRRSPGRLGDKMYLDDAVGQDGFVLKVLVQSRRNAKAARRLIRKLLKG